MGFWGAAGKRLGAAAAGVSAALVGGAASAAHNSVARTNASIATLPTAQKWGVHAVDVGNFFLNVFTERVDASSDEQQYREDALWARVNNPNSPEVQKRAAALQRVIIQFHHEDPATRAAILRDSVFNRKEEQKAIAQAIGRTGGASGWRAELDTVALHTAVRALRSHLDSVRAEAPAVVAQLEKKIAHTENTLRMSIIDVAQMTIAESSGQVTAGELRATYDAMAAAFDDTVDVVEASATAYVSEYTQLPPAIDTPELREAVREDRTQRASREDSAVLEMSAADAMDVEKLEKMFEQVADDAEIPAPERETPLAETAAAAIAPAESISDPVQSAETPSAERAGGDGDGATGVTESIVSSDAVITNSGAVVLGPVAGDDAESAEEEADEEQARVAGARETLDIARKQRETVQHAEVEAAQEEPEEPLDVAAASQKPDAPEVSLEENSGDGSDPSGTSEVVPQGVPSSEGGAALEGFAAAGEEEAEAKAEEAREGAVQDAEKAREDLQQQKEAVKDGVENVEKAAKDTENTEAAAITESETATPSEDVAVSQAPETSEVPDGQGLAPETFAEAAPADAEAGFVSAEERRAALDELLDKDEKQQAEAAAEEPGETPDELKQQLHEAVAKADAATDEASEASGEETTEEKTPESLAGEHVEATAEEAENTAGKTEATVDAEDSAETEPQPEPQASEIKPPEAESVEVTEAERTELASEPEPAAPTAVEEAIEAPEPAVVEAETAEPEPQPELREPVAAEQSEAKAPETEAPERSEDTAPAAAHEPSAQQERPSAERREQSESAVPPSIEVRREEVRREKHKELGLAPEESARTDITSEEALTPRQEAEARKRKDFDALFDIATSEQVSAQLATVTPDAVEQEKKRPRGEHAKKAPTAALVIDTLRAQLTAEIKEISGDAADGTEFLKRTQHQRAVLDMLEKMENSAKRPNRKGRKAAVEAERWAGALVESAQKQEAHKASQQPKNRATVGHPPPRGLHSLPSPIQRDNAATRAAQSRRSPLAAA